MPNWILESPRPSLPGPQPHGTPTSCDMPSPKLGGTLLPRGDLLPFCEQEGRGKLCPTAHQPCTGFPATPI